MKLFQQLLVAPAALGLMAPVAASAAELNLQTVDAYAADSAEQVTSVSQFGDVKPTDWAYQALSNLIERYGCVAGYPDGSFRGGRAMTRYEAAALLNACLDRVTEVTDELKRLMAEFEKELALLKGRVDGLEAKVGELEANQFSTTTKLKGIATFVVGANSFGGSATPGPLVRAAAGMAPGQSFADMARQMEGATTFNYDVRLNLDTSFTGKDLLRTTLRAGNFADSGFGNGVTLNQLEVAFQEACGTGMDCGDVVAVNRLFYQFPIGSNFTATIGARVRQDDMLAMWPSAYPADTVLDVFTYAGAPGTYNLNLGAGGGLWWKSGGFSISANYVSANADNGYTEPLASCRSEDYPDNLATDCGGGIGNSTSAQTGTVQVAYAGANFGIAAAYNYTSDFYGNVYAGNATPLAAYLGKADGTNSFGISGYWQPLNASWFPSISGGWGINRTGDDDSVRFSTSFTSQSWYVGLQWADAFIKGNTLGMAVGQPTFVTSLPDSPVLPNGASIGTTPNDGNYAWEWWYKIQVTDNISVTPAIFYLSAPLGQLQKTDGESFTNFGGLVKTTFKF